MKALLVVLMITMGAVDTANSANETLAKPCLDLKVGTIGLGQFYLLSVVAKNHNEVTSEIKRSLDKMILTSKDIDKICSIVELSS